VAAELKLPRRELPLDIRERFHGRPYSIASAALPSATAAIALAFIRVHQRFPLLDASTSTRT
jgi:hypothetical protein